MTSSKILGVIPARYASTRLPAKLLIPILGKSLLQRTFENALTIPFLDELIVATDDQRIFDHVQQFGGNPVMTSIDCPNGTQRLAEAIQKKRDWLDFSAVINIQGDHPFTDPKAIEHAVNLLLEDPMASMATIITPLKSEKEALNPSIVKCVIDKHQNALYFSRTLIPSNHRQAFNPKNNYYKHIGLYVYRPSFLLHYLTLEPTPLQLEEDLEQLKVLENGYRIKVAITDKESPGVDEFEDLKKVEQWLCN